MATARSIIDRSARIAGILASGETLSGNEANDALTMFGAMCDEWNINGLLQHELKKDPISVTASSSSFAISKDHPIISQATFVSSDSIERPLRIITVDEWAKISNKSLTAPFPQVMFFNNNDNGTATAYLWPIPSSDITVDIWRRAGFATPSDLDTNIDFPYSVINALTYELASEFCIEYGKPISPDLRDRILKAKDAVKRSNVKVPKIVSDINISPRRKYANIYTGEV